MQQHSKKSSASPNEEEGENELWVDLADLYQLDLKKLNKEWERK